MNNPEAPSPTAHPFVEINWVHGIEFDIGRQDGPKVRIDGDSKAGPSPFDVLLGALAACAASDVVTILAKQRTPVHSLHVAVDAKRVTDTPRRLASAVLNFRIRAPGTTREKVERSIELAVRKYCSVGSSLRTDAPVTWTVDLQS
jgi:putative redox protein